MAGGFTGHLENGDLPDPASIITPELVAAMQEAVLLLERDIKKNTPIGVTEAARGSIGSEVQRGATIGRGVPPIRGAVGSPLEYVEVIDRGRRPGSRMPPPDALELWVRRRLAVKDVQEARSVAFAIARSIARRGTRPVLMFEKAAEKDEPKIAQIFERAGVKMSLRIERE